MTDLQKLILKLNHECQYCLIAIRLDYNDSAWKSVSVIVNLISQLLAVVHKECGEDKALEVAKEFGLILPEVIKAQSNRDLCCIEDTLESRLLPFIKHIEGASEVVCLGLDLAYTGNQMHIAVADDINNVEDHETMCEVKSVAGGTVPTVQNLNSYRKWIEQRLKRYNGTTKVSAFCCPVVTGLIFCPKISLDRLIVRCDLIYHPYFVMVE